MKVKIMGGLGNQLFQLATALSRSKGKDKVIVDTSYFEKDSRHGGYRINNLLFDCFEFYSPTKFESLLSKIFLKFPLLTLFSRVFVHEKYSGSSGDYMLGYWQNAENFDNIFCSLKESIVPRSFDCEEHKDLLRDIDLYESVAIHVRRGDYVDENIIKNHGICSEYYYVDAIKEVLKRKTDLVFFVFSNDFDWVEEKLKPLFSDFMFVNVVGNSAEEDLYLMSKCKNHIIANSSFSWWGAFLGKSDDQIVISPTPWYEKKQRSSEDPSLASWIRVKK